MLWIGITGPMGSGKSTVGECLRNQGFAVLDADKIVHELMAPGGPVQAEIIKTFGGGVADESGGLDRRALGRAVFGDKLKLAQLEGILHPRVRAEVERRRQTFASQGMRAAFYDVPLLFEKDMQKNFDHVVVVTAPEKLRQERVFKRSNLSEAEFLERSRHQLAPEVKERQAAFVIHNDRDLAHLEDEIKRMRKAFGF